MEYVLLIDLESIFSIFNLNSKKTDSRKKGIQERKKSRKTEIEKEKKNKEKEETQKEKCITKNIIKKKE